MKLFVYKVENCYNPNYNTNFFHHYMAIEPIQFVNREKGDYKNQGSICIGNPKFFFKVSLYDPKITTIIDDKEIKYRDYHQIESYHVDKIYDFKIHNLTIFKKENFNFSVEDNRDQRIDEILKHEEI